VNNPLAEHALSLTQPRGFDEQRAVTPVAQPVQQPQAGDTTTDDGNIER